MIEFSITDTFTDRHAMAGFFRLATGADIKMFGLNKDGNGQEVVSP